MNKIVGTQYDRVQAIPDLTHIHGAIMSQVQFTRTQEAKPGKENTCRSH